MIEFNFKITYRSKIQKKIDNFTRRSKKFSKNHNDKRHRYNHAIFFKKQNLNKKIRNAIDMTTMFMNEKRQNVITFAIILYVLNEKKFYAKNDEIASKKNDSQSNIMKRIKTTYFENVTFQKIMQNKRDERKKIFSNITKNEVRLKLKNCQIKNELLYVKNKIYVFNDEMLHVSILSQIHDNSSKKHVDKTTTYDRLNRHYY